PMKNKKLFMLLFRFTPNVEYQPTEQEQAQIKEQWGSFIGNIALKEKLVSTYQLGFEGRQVATDKSVSNGIVVLENTTLGGNMVVQANSLEEASELAKNCPILSMGGSVEVRSIIPMDN
ncbi:MAG: YciI family protein, partial [Bacteroidota bacterium]